MIIEHYKVKDLPEEKDPFEKNNIAASTPEIVKDLTEKIKAFRAE